MSIRCLLGFHKWNHTPEFPKHGDERFCIRCGLIQSYFDLSWGDDFLSASVRGWINTGYDDSLILKGGKKK